MKKHSVRNLSVSGLLGALVLLFTAYLHIPVGKGYVHIGDAFVYLGSVLLPLPYGLIAAVGGAVLADCLSGYALWAPASLAIKGLSVLFFTSKGQKVLCLRNCLAPLWAGFLCAGGYYLYEALIYGDYVTPLLSVPGNLLQSLCSGVIFFLVVTALRNRKPVVKE